jgi:type IV pilus assembly protein PilA
MLKSDFNNGFIIIEMMVVIAIIAILSTIALPSFEYKNVRAQTVESVELIKTMKDSVNLFYSAQHKFPRNNLQAGIPKPEQLIGNYVQRIDFVNGAFHITFGNRVNTRLRDKVLSIRPIVVKDSPESPISWLCGNAKVPDGMVAVGENKTDIENSYLPMNCF